MQSSYQETRLDRLLAYVAEFLIVFSCLSCIIYTLSGDDLALVSGSIISLVQLFLIAFRREIIVLLMAFLLALINLSVPIHHYFDIYRYHFPGVPDESSQFYLLMTGVFFQVLALSILVFRRLRFSWHQKRAERA